MMPSESNSLIFYPLLPEVTNKLDRIIEADIFGIYQHNQERIQKLGEIIPTNPER
jgi:hypothetical protein